MNNLKLTLVGVGIVASATQTYAKESKQSAERPNILMVVCEDISPYLGCYGDKIAKSPNLDRFAESSILFSQMHTTVGVSAPSRFALITGMYPSAMGANYMRTFTAKPEQYPSDMTPYHVILPDEVKGHVEYMREAGYYCTNNNKNDYQFNTPLSMWDENNNKAHWRNRPEGMPFYSVFNLMITHESNTWVQNDAPLSVNPDDITPPPYYPNDEITRHDMAVVYSNIARMDQQFQGYVDQLKESGDYDNTIIIFLSDNGGPLPRQKRAIYESGTHVPFMVQLPDGYGAGSVDDRLSMFIDIPATILSLAGIKPPSYMHGEALLGEYAQKKEREYIYAARDRMDEQRDKQGAVKDSRYRYIRNYNLDRSNYMGVGYRFNMKLMNNLLALRDEGKLNETQMLWFNTDRQPEEFYDDIEDPHNVNNLINDPRYKDDIDRLRKEYDRWIKTDNQRWLLSEQESRDQMLPNNGEQPRLSQPTLSTKGGKVTLKSDNKGASMVYRVNGIGYNERSWILYSKPIEGLKEGDKITAIATRAGYINSTPLEYSL